MLTSALYLRRCLSVRKPAGYSGYRCLQSLCRNLQATEDSDNNLVVVEGNAGSRTAVLNRPASLNAINTPMAVRLQSLYDDWEFHPNIGFVVLKGRGRAFCAGGDLIYLHNLMRQGKYEECKQLFWNAYGLIYSIATYSKPHTLNYMQVAIMDGITVGGGAGISVPGTFRIATDKTIFATPEALIGFHPDGGASYYLSRLPGYLGEYLALTGDRLNGSEMVSCGLATHYIHTTKLPLVEEVLRNLDTDRPSDIGTCLQSLGDPVHHHKTSLVHRIETLNRCFSHDTVEEIIQSLEEEAAQKNDKWCASTLKKLNQSAPLSLKVSLRSIRDGRNQGLEQCLIREYRMTVQAMSGQISSDFYEGIQAKLVEKHDKPKWDPPRLEHVSQDMVDQYFSPLSPYELDIDLPTCIL